MQLTVMVTNISRTGCRLECLAPLIRRKPVIVRFENGVRKPATIKWSKTGAYGCEFDTPLDENVLFDFANSG